MSARETYLEVTLHDDGKPHIWAEWDLFWNERNEAGRIGSGTAPSMEGAIDAALDTWRDWIAFREPAR